MFEQTFVQSQAQTRKPWTVALSLSVQCLAVGLLLLMPLLHLETLRMPDPPQPHLIRTWIDQPPAPVQRTTPHATTTNAPVVPRPVFLIPTVPHGPARTIDAPTSEPELTAWSGPIGNAIGTDLPNTTLLPLPKAVQQPEQTKVTKSASTSGPVRISTGVEAARLIFGPSPAYPPLAKMARSQGVVKMEAIIAADGAIRNLRVISGPPLLVDAALGAVKQWRYQPTILNGVAVEVVTEIEVNFTLTR